MEDEISFLRKKVQELEAEVKRLKLVNAALKDFMTAVEEDIHAFVSG